jgi:hypothetical protein
MFQKTLALSTNPFDPEIANGPQNLAGNPLRIDQHDDDAVQKLFCWKLAGLEENRARIERVLFGPKQLGTQPAAVKQGIIVIRGGRGTGKTTLASFINRRVLKESTQPSGGWKPIETNFPATDDPTSIQDFSSRLNEVRERIKQKVGQPPDNVFLFLDDVPPGGLIGVITLFQDFKMHSQVYVVTTTDQKLSQNELDCSYAAKITIVETNNVNAVDLHSYMADRVGLYRMPKRTDFDKISPIFPWAQTAPDRLLGNQTSDQPLRLLNRKLSRQVEDHHEELLQLNPKVDIGAVAEADLKQYLIS